MKQATDGSVFTSGELALANNKVVILTAALRAAKATLSKEVFSRCCRESRLAPGSAAVKYVRDVIIIDDSDDDSKYPSAPMSSVGGDASASPAGHISDAEYEGVLEDMDTVRRRSGAFTLALPSLTYHLLRYHK